MSPEQWPKGIAIRQVGVAPKKRRLQQIAALLRHLSPNRQAREEQIIAAIGDPGNRVFVAVDRNKRYKVVGVVILNTRAGFFENYGWMAELVVSKFYRGRNIGQALVERVLEAAAEAGLAGVDFTSKPGRVAANILYTKMGAILLAVANPEAPDETGTNYYRFDVPLKEAA